MLCFIIIFLGACSTNKVEKKETSTTARATIADNIAEKPKWTDTVIGPWYIRLHNPGGHTHTVWEGPIEIGKKPGVFFCTIDTSLIKGVRTGTQQNIIIIEAFSGSKAYDILVNLDSCKTINSKVSN